MVRRAAALAALMTIGASSVSLAAAAAYLGDWARGDGKTRIHVASCGAAICARNTWVRHGVSGEKVGDRLILRVKPTGPGHWSGNAFDPQRQRELRNQCSCQRQAHDHPRMRDGWVCV